MLNLQTSKPQWVRQGCVLDLDFANNRYWGGYVSLGNGTSTTDRAKSMLTPQSNAAAGVNYSLAGDGLYYPQKTAASARILPGIGLYSEVDSNNTCLQSRDLSNASWTKTNVTATKNQTGIDGIANTASTITASAGNGTVLQTPAASTSRFRMFSCFMKRLVGTGAINLTLDNGGAWTDVSGSINSTTWTRVFISATSANPTVGFQIVVNADSVAVDFCQHEFGSGPLIALLPAVPTSPMLTTATAVTRLNGGSTEEAFFNNPSVSAGYNDGWRWIDYMTCKQPVAFVWEGAGNAASGTNPLLTGTDLGGYFITGGVNGDTVAGASGGVAGINNLNKIAYSKGGANQRSCVNGNAINSTATAFSNTQATHGGIGNRGSGDTSINGYCKRVTYFVRELSDGEMLEYTR